MTAVQRAEVSLPALLEMHRRGSELIGREAVRAALHDDWRAVSAGGSRVAVLSGEAGIGKTRLAAEVAEDARTESAVVLFGACASEAIIPYQAVIDALRPRISQDPKLASPALAPLLPGVLDATDARPLSDALNDRVRLFQAITTTMRAIARQRPTVLVLDDLHWADPDTVALIGQLLRATQDLSLFVIATVRDTDVDQQGPLPDLLADLRSDTRVRRVQLEGLGVRDIAALGAVLAGRPMADDDPSVSAIHDRSRGNAYFARELWAHVLEGGTGLPSGVQDAVLARLDRLNGGELDILTIAATIGTVFPLDVLVAAADGDENAVESALDRAIAIGLVAEHDAAAIAYRFPHDLVRETLESTGLETRRQRRHARVAAAFITARADANPAEVARHLARAGESADAEELVRYASAAAAHAESVLAWSDAALHWQFAADGADRARHSAGERAELRLHEGMSWGRANNVDAARAAYAAAEALANEAGDAALEARSVMWRATHTLYQTAADAPTAIAMLDAARSRAPSLDAATAAQLMSHLAVSTWTSGNFDVAVEFAEEAIALGRESGERGACSRAEMALSVIAWLSVDLEAAESHLVAALDDGEAADDPWLTSSADSRLALTRLWRGDVGDARAAAESTLDRAAKDGNLNAHAVALGALAGVALVQGRFADVELHAAEAMEAMTITGYEWFVPMLASTAAAAHLAVGSWSDAERWLDRVGVKGLDAFGTTDLAHWILTMRAWALRGDYEVVRTEAARHAGRLDGRMAMTTGAGQLLAALADLADVTGTAVTIDRVERRLGRLRDRGLVIAEGSCALVDRVRAQAARLAGDPAGARDALAAAVATAERLGLRPELAHCRLEEGRLALDDDRRRASAILDDARDRFAELGMTPWQQRSESLARWAAR